MTEKDRIIKKGIISESFFNEEIRCEFLVSEERKKMWAVLLDMLMEVDRVCKKYGLKYFLCYGSILGAVRHNGFIPWDDDIDIVMPREDYDKFCQLGAEFSNPLFFQTPYSDPGYFYTPVRIRNSNTSAVVETFKHNRFNHGIWLSVFPLDGWNPVGGEERYAYLRTLVMELSTYMRKDSPSLSEKDKLRVNSYCGRDPFDIYEEIQRIARYGNCANTPYCILATITQGKYVEKLLLKEDFEDQVFWDVEGFKFPIPSGFEHLLKTWYGDYMQLPPVEHRGNWHSGTIFDADKPYLEYIEEGK